LQLRAGAGQKFRVETSRARSLASTVAFLVLSQDMMEDIFCSALKRTVSHVIRNHIAAKHTWKNISTLSLVQLSSVKFSQVRSPVDFALLVLLPNLDHRQPPLHLHHREHSICECTSIFLLANLILTGGKYNGLPDSITETSKDIVPLSVAETHCCFICWCSGHI
jgi:hypothetical protein